MAKGRPNRSSERQRALLPTIARTFAELGYRRTTTAELAARCDTHETALYRLWPDKKAMFIAAIEYVYDLSAAKWEELLAGGDDRRSAAERLLEYESRHHGEYGLYRIIFAGLSECDDAQVRDALSRTYRRYHEFIVRRLIEHHGEDRRSVAAEVSAWAIIGMGTITSIGRELGLLSPAERRRLWERVGPALLEAGAG